MTRASRAILFTVMAVAGILLLLSFLYDSDQQSRPEEVLRKKKSNRGELLAPQAPSRFRGASAQGADKQLQIPGVTTEPAVLVTGRTLDSKRQPLVGCQVALARATGPLELTTQTQTISDHRGAYRLLAPLTPELLLIGSHPGYVEVIAHVPVAKGSTRPSPSGRYRPVRHEQDLILPESGSIRGRVVDAMNQPLAGVSVRALTKSSTGASHGRPSSPTYSTLDGSFTVLSVPRGRAILLAEMPGHVPLSIGVESPAEGITLRMLSGGATVSGRVTDASTSQPVAGAEVSLRSDFAENQYYGDIKTATAADGSFVLKHLPAATFDLVARKGSLRLVPPSEPGAYALHLARDEQRTGLDLHLYPGHTIRGVIREKDTTTPLASAQVWSSSPEGGSVTTTTANDGSYLLAGVTATETNQATLHAGKQGYTFAPPGAHADIKRLRIVLPQNEWELQQDLEMTRNMTISGTVRDQDGNPVPSATVELLTLNSFPGAERKSVDGAGQYELEVSPDTTAKVNAQAPGYGPAYSRAVAIGKTGVTGIDVTLNAPATVEGIVVDEKDDPVAGARVEGITRGELSGGSGGMTQFNRSPPVYSGSDGTFVIHNLPPQDVTLSAFQEGRPQSRAVTVPLKGGEWKSGVKLVFGKPHFLAGRITLTDGRPVQRAEISAVPSDNDLANRTQTKTNTDGRYRLEQLPSAEVDLRIVDEERKLHKNAKNIKTDRENADFVLGDEYSVVMTGYVLDPQDQPVENFSVRSQSSGVQTQKDTSRTGVFTAKLKPGDAETFTIDTREYAKLTERVQVPAGVSHFDRRFRLGTSGNIEGTVVEKSSGAPMAGVLVYVAAGDELWNRVESKAKFRTTTSPSGTFRIESVPPGAVTVMVSPPSPLPQLARKGEVVSDQTCSLGRIEVSTGGTIRGIIHDSSRQQPLAKVPIELVCMSSVQANTTSGADGSFSFENLAASSYAVRAPQQNVGAFVSLSENQVREIELDVASGHIALYVRSAGTPVGGASVGSTLAMATHHYRGPMGNTNSEGYFLMENLRPGRWQVYVSRGDGTPSHSNYVDVEGGETATVMMDLPTGLIAGTVVDSSGTPVAAASVALSGSTPAHYQNSRKAISAGNGGFSFASVAPGTYSLTAVREGKGSVFVGGVVVPVEGPGPQPIQLQLQGGTGGTLISVALQQSNGQPLPAAWCRLMSSSGEYIHGQVRDDHGVLQITGIPPAIYEAWVGSYGFSQLSHSVEIRDGETVTLRDVLSRSGSFTWMLTDSAGKVRPGIRCKLVHESHVAANREGLTNEQGLWYGTDLAPGRYEGTATDAGGASARISVEITPGQHQGNTSVLAN